MLGACDAAESDVRCEDGFGFFRTSGAGAAAAATTGAGTGGASGARAGAGACDAGACSGGNPGLKDDRLEEYLRNQLQL